MTATLSPLYADADLELAMGGAYRLVELAAGAQSQSDAIYTAFLTRIRQASQSKVYGLMGIAFDPLDTTVAGTDSRAPTLCIAIAIYYAWFYGTGGQAIPDAVNREYQDAEAGLMAIRDGKSGLGTANAPTMKPGYASVQVCHGVTRRTMRRF